MKNKKRTGVTLIVLVLASLLLILPHALARRATWQTGTPTPTPTPTPKKLAPIPLGGVTGESPGCSKLRHNWAYYQEKVLNGQFLGPDSREVFEEEAENNRRGYCKCLIDGHFVPIPEACLDLVGPNPPTTPQKVNADIPELNEQYYLEALSLEDICPDCRDERQKFVRLLNRKSYVLAQLEVERKRAGEQAAIAQANMSKLRKEADGLPDEVARAFNELINCLKDCCKRKAACSSTGNSAAPGESCPECDALGAELFNLEEKENALFRKVIDLYSKWLEAAKGLVAGSENYVATDNVFQATRAKLLGELKDARQL